jgi:hypothetical protein
VITAVSPKAALAGTTVANFQVTGFNLTGSAFVFIPSFVPAAITVNSTSINPAGTTATLNITIGAQAGQYVLIATNGEGSSNTTPSAGNTFGVADSSTNTDADGDGFQDGLEAALGSDPFDKNSVPSPLLLLPTEMTGPTFSVVNLVPPPSGIPTFEAVSQTFSVVNSAAPPPGIPTFEAVSQTFSVVNGSSPPSGIPMSEAVSQTFSVQNQP